MFKSRKYPIVGLGGTFDHFHDGHAKFLDFAAEHGRELLIGVTTPQLSAQKPFAHNIESFLTRKKSVQRYCKQNHIQAKIIELYDAYGPTLEPKTVQALCVTEETVKGADKINDARHAAGMNRIPMFICYMKNDETGQVLHAEGIRAGKVSRKGIVYLSHFEDTLTLSQTQKEFFKKPLGEIISEPSFDKHQLQVVVGDETLQRFLENDWPLDLAFYDHKTQRQPLDNQLLTKIEPTKTITNQSGEINAQVWEYLKELSDNFFEDLAEKPALIKIEGEEDLLTAALILALPLKTQLYYGQPNEGLVEVTITEKIKKDIFELFT